MIKLQIAGKVQLNKACGLRLKFVASLCVARYKTLLRAEGSL